jgi:hypothetical protein
MTYSVFCAANVKIWVYLFKNSRILAKSLWAIIKKEEAAKLRHPLFCCLPSLGRLKYCRRSGAFLFTMCFHLQSICPVCFIFKQQNVANIQTSKPSQTTLD